jgi:3-methyladenine DNA glycosylase Mpg
VSEALGPEFYERSVHEVARELIGCTLMYGDCGGVIVETESCLLNTYPSPRD